MKVHCSPLSPPRPTPCPARLQRGAIVLALSLLLCACSRAPEPGTSVAVSSPYVAVARGRVDVQGGLLALSMPREGILTKVAVHEGDQVKQGQLLAQLDTRPATLAVDAAQAGLEQAQAQTRLLAVKLTAAKQRAERLRAAVKAGAGDGQSADDAREAVAQLDAEQQGARATLDMARQKLDEARYELKQRSLLAPFDADVVKVTAQAGASVSPTAGPLITLLSSKPRIVRAELNESFVGMIKPGMHAEVSANSGNPDEHWGAHVLRIGQVYTPAMLGDDPQVRANARTVECVLAFDQPQNLRIGQRVTVRFGASTAKQAPKD